MSIHIAKPGREPRVIAWEFPESFEEFDRGQLLALATYVDTVGSDQLAYVKLVRALLGIRRRWLKYIDGAELFFPEEDEDGDPRMLPQLDYLK